MIGIKGESGSEMIGGGGIKALGLEQKTQPDMGAGVTRTQSDCRFVMPLGIVMPSSFQEHGSKVVVGFGGSRPKGERTLKPEYGLRPSGRDLMFSAPSEAILESLRQKTEVWGGMGVDCHESAQFFKSLGGGIIVDASPVANVVLEKMTGSGGRGSFPPDMGGLRRGHLAYHARWGQIC
nr:hypothetical protein [Azospirillum sp.]